MSAEKHNDVSPLVDELRRIDVTAPTGASDRIWRKLHRERAPRRRVEWLVFVGCAAVAALAVFALRVPAPEVIRGDGFVAQHAGRGRTLQHASDGELETLSVTGGTLSVSTWGRRVRIEASGHVVTAEAAVFTVMAGDSFSVEVGEGVVHVDGERVERATPSGAVSVRAVESLEPAEASGQRRWREAELLVEAGAPAKAVTVWSAMAADGLRAEAALLKVGQTQLWQLHQPDKALQSLQTMQLRFPHGSLQQEAALSRLEALLALRSFAAARGEASAFEAAFPSSERVAEVRAVSAVAAWESGDRAAACREVQALDGAVNAAVQSLRVACETVPR